MRVTRGLHRRADAADPRVAELHAWQLVLPADAAFSALTAAEQWGWDLPPCAQDLPVCAAMPYGATAPVRPGQLAVSRHRLPPPYVVKDGLRLTTPAETLLTCAPLMGVLDLVVLVDSALRAGDVELLELWMLWSRRRRGVPVLRQALLLADPQAGSVMETLLRVLHVVCDLDVETQYVVRDAAGFWWRGPTSGCAAPGTCRSTTVRSMPAARSSARTDDATVAWRRRAGRVTASPTTTCSVDR